MGDQVQKLLEEMVPELEDLQTRGLFTSAEVKAIVRKRTDFEYRFHRRVPLLSDFLRYIQYEMNLDMLRKKRKSRLGLIKQSASDYAPVKRIHFIYERALRKFNNDIGLWLQFIDFAAKAGSDKILSGLFPRALRLHSQVPVLWVRAAQWEQRHNQDMDAARHMLQRGIRINPASPGLYLYFFKLEVDYTGKIRERRRILGLSTSAAADESKDPSELIAAAKAAAAALTPNGDDDGSDSKDEKTKNAEKTATVNASERAILSGILPLTIFKSALRVPSLADDLSLRLQFLSAIPHSCNPRYARKKLIKSLNRRAASSGKPTKTEGDEKKVDESKDEAAAGAGGAAADAKATKKRRRGVDEYGETGVNADSTTKTDSNGDAIVNDDDGDDDEEVDDGDATTNADNSAPLDTSSFVASGALDAQAAIDADLQPLCQQIIDSLSKDFATTPEVWRIRALWQLSLARAARTRALLAGTSSDENTIVDMEKIPITEWEAAVNVATAGGDMWMAYATYLHDRLQYYSDITATPAAPATITKGGKRSRIDPRASVAVNTTEQQAVCEWLVARILEIGETAMQLQKLTPSLLIMWATLLLQSGKESDAAVVARLGVSPSWFASSAPVWLLLIHLQTKRYALQLASTGVAAAKAAKKAVTSTESKGEASSSTSTVTFGSIIALYDQALASVSPSTSFDIWRRLIDLHIARVAAFPTSLPVAGAEAIAKQRRSAHRACVAAFRAAIAASSPAASAASATSAAASSSTTLAEGDSPSTGYCVEGQQFKQQYIEWLVLDGTSSADDIRVACDFVCAARPASLTLYFTCLRATNASFASDKDSSARLRAVYEAAIVDFGKQSPELWLEFIAWELAAKNFQRANQTHWRAIKTLSSLHQSAFTEAYNRIVK